MAAAAGLLLAVCGALSARLLSHIVGVEGMGVFSILREFQRSLVLLGSLGGGAAVVQGIASRDKAESVHFAAAIFKLQTILSLSLAAVIVVTAASLSQTLGVDRQGGASMVLLMAPAIILAVLCNFTNAAMNAKMLVAPYAIAQTMLGLGLLVGTVPLAEAYRAGAVWALPALLAAPFATSSLFGFIVLLRYNALEGFWSSLKGKVDLGALKQAGAMALALFISQAANSWAALTIRSSLAKMHGIHEPGLLDPAWSMSTIYITGILSALNIYYFPHLAAAKDKAAAIGLLANVQKLATFLMFGAIALLLMFQPFVISKLYNPDFIDAHYAMRYMLIGDYLRGAGLVLSMVLITRQRMTNYLVIELLSTTVLLAVSFAGLKNYPLEAVGLGYAVAFAVHLTLYVFSAYKELGTRPNLGIAASFLGGLGCLLFINYRTWSVLQTQFDWPAVVAFILGCGVLTVSLAGKSGRSPARVPETIAVEGSFAEQYNEECPKQRVP